MITSTAASADLFLGNLQSVAVGRRRDQSYRLPCLLLRYLMTHEDTAKQQPNQSRVNNGGDGNAVGPVVVVSAPYLA